MGSIMRKIFSFGLMAALVCGISMSITSCKDDNNDSKSDEQRAEEQKAQASKALKFYEVVSHLADLSAMDDATYASQTFEPIIGEESQNDPLTRIVATNTFDQKMTGLEFIDETLINFTGRVVGGSIEGEKPVGFGLSENNIGVAELVYVLLFFCLFSHFRCSLILIILKNFTKKCS